MRTNQVMKRTLPIVGIAGEVYNPATIRQRTEDGYFNATDLLKVYNRITNSRKKLAHFFENQQTKDFSQVIENQQHAKGRNSDLLENTEKQAVVGVVKKAFYKARGRSGGTWMHPYLFLDFGMWLSPEFKYQVIRWVYDNLIKLRIEGADTYKELNKATKEHYIARYNEDPPQKIFIDQARQIREAIGAQDWNMEPEKKQELRTNIHNTLILAHKKKMPKYKRDRLIEFEVDKMAVARKNPHQGAF